LNVSSVPASPKHSFSPQQNYAMSFPTTITLDGVNYTVDSASTGGRYLVAYDCSACQWFDCTPLLATPAEAMDAALAAVNTHHAKHHGGSPSCSSRGCDD
jgi:hypothetical protein